MEKITSRENAKIKYACRLASSGAFRRSEGKFLAEGRKLCPELCRGAALETLFCTEAALEKCPELAGLPESLAKGSVVASDAFFPFADGLEAAAAAGVTAVIQPGGSIRDKEVIAAADAAGLAMVFTGMRHFRH